MQIGCGSNRIAIQTFPVWIFGSVLFCRYLFLIFGIAVSMKFANRGPLIFSQRRSIVIQSWQRIPGSADRYISTVWVAFSKRRWQLELEVIIVEVFFFLGYCGEILHLTKRSVPYISNTNQINLVTNHRTWSAQFTNHYEPPWLELSFEAFGLVT